MALRKCAPRVAQGLDRASEIVNFESDAVPAARLGLAAIGHGLGGSPGASWGVEQELEVASREHGEAGAGVEVDLEAEMLGVECDRRLDVMDYIAHADGSHGAFSFD